MEELDLTQLFELFWNKKTEVILIILLFIVIGITYTICLVTPKYTSKTTLLLATEQGTGTTSSQTTATDLTLSSKLVSTYRELLKSSKIVRQVIGNLGIDMSEDALKGSISVQAKSDANILEISVTNTDPELAAQIANELATVFSEQVKEEYFKINNVQVIDVAEVEENPSNINHAKDIIIFAFIGIVVAAAYVLIANMLDTTVKSAEDIEKLCSVTVLASIPLENFETKRGGKK